MKSTANMFALSTTLYLHTLLNQNLNQQQLYAKLFANIIKNSFIHNFIESIPDDINKETKVQNLLDAINCGDHDAEIFSDEYCSLYLLRLIKDEKIKFIPGMSVYLYLMVLMQFTDKQSLRPEHAQYKALRDIKVENLLTEDGNRYLKVAANFLRIHTGIDSYEELVNFAKNLTKSEQWLIKIPFTGRDYLGQYKTRFDAWISELLFNGSRIPVLIGLGNFDGYELYLPSLAIIIFCLQKVNFAPIELQISFGVSGLASLRKMHQNNKHPFSLYSPYAKSNLVAVHGFLCGPIGVAIHDFSHAYWGGLLSLKFREKIFNFVIPNFEKMKTITENHGDRKTTSIIEDALIQFADFDLFSFAHKPLGERQTRYLAMPFRDITLDFELGESKFDKLYYLLEYIKLQAKHWSADEIDIWQKLSDIILKKIHSNNAVALRMLAKNAVISAKIIASNSLDIVIDWHKWLNLAKEYDDPKIFWEKANHADNYKELLRLITDYNLLLLPPYLTLGNNQRLEFINFLEKQIDYQEQCNEAELKLAM